MRCPSFAPSLGPGRPKLSLKLKLGPCCTACVACCRCSCCRGGCLQRLQKCFAACRSHILLLNAAAASASGSAAAAASAAALAGCLFNLFAHFHYFPVTVVLTTRLHISFSLAQQNLRCNVFIAVHFHTLPQAQCIATTCAAPALPHVAVATHVFDFFSNIKRFSLQHRYLFISNLSPWAREIIKNAGIEKNR